MRSIVNASILALAFLVVLSGCDVIDRTEPSTAISQGTALSSETAVEGVRASMFDRMHSIGLSTDWLLGPSSLADNTSFRGNQERHQLLNVMAGVRELGRDEILAEMEDKVFIVDNSKIVIDCNRAAAQTFGKTPEEMIGRQLDTIAPQLEEVLSDDGEGVQRVMSIEINGNVRTFDVQLSIIERPYGVPNASLLSLRDVTRQTRREQQLDVLNRLLRHNLRNEMNVIRGHAELLEDWVEEVEEEPAEHDEHADEADDDA